MVGPFEMSLGAKFLGASASFLAAYAFLWRSECPDKRMWSIHHARAHGSRSLPSMIHERFFEPHKTHTYMWVVGEEEDGTILCVCGAACHTCGYVRPVIEQVQPFDSHMRAIYETLSEEDQKRHLPYKRETDSGVAVWTDPRLVEAWRQDAQTRKDITEQRRAMYEEVPDMAAKQNAEGAHGAPLVPIAYNPMNLVIGE